MKQKLTFFRNIALGLCVVGALVFGASQAAAYTTCVTCSWPSGVECKDENNPYIFCMNKCINEWDCWGGECHYGGASECRCFE